MIFYGTILPPEQSHTHPTIISINQNDTLEKSPNLDFNSGECRATTTKCLGLLFILSAILITWQFLTG